MREWAANYQADYLSIKADDSVLSEMAIKQIDIDSSPLDMRKDSVRGLVDALPISDEGKEKLFSYSTIQVKVWQGLKPGHVQNALQKRAEGKI